MLFILLSLLLISASKLQRNHGQGKSCGLYWLCTQSGTPGSKQEISKMDAKGKIKSQLTVQVKIIVNKWSLGFKRYYFNKKKLMLCSCRKYLYPLPPMEGIFPVTPSPTGNFNLASYFPLEPHPPQISNPLSVGSMDIFWNYTFRLEKHRPGF